MNKERFLLLLKKAELTQLGLCELIDVNKSTLTRWNNDNSYPVWLEDYLCWQIAKDKLKDLKVFIDDIQPLLN
jgi:DNA-binding XRE family transcriptional regulator